MALCGSRGKYGEESGWIIGIQRGNRGTLGE